jgi:NADH dehydrogenase (ubiquinone) 1 alpha subcomplex subunit 9
MQAASIQKRFLSQLAKSNHSLLRYGRGGRSSNSGLTVAVFGNTGFIGRYLLEELGEMQIIFILCDFPYFF